ncbi:MAG: hypothetical protein HG423_008190 [Propionibacterium sp.]|nr:hypothetical protein [Propionibacterium sp.]
MELIDTPCFTASIRLSWRKHQWRCLEALCPVISWLEQNPQIAQPREF